jgi:sensor histidine kinase YesM
MPPASPTPTAWTVVRRTLRELPAETRRGFRLVLIAWLAVLVLQIWDSADRPDARGAAELLSVLLGTAGVMLVGFAAALRRAEDSPGDRPAVRQILMALPTLAALAAALLAAAMTTLVARVWLGTSPIVIVIAALYLAAFIFAISVVHDAARRLFEFGQREAARGARAEAQLAEARLSTLQAQMHPHFLFNALNTVAALISSDPEAAERTVEDLADVLRASLDRSQNRAGTLGDELDFIRAWLAIEQRRFGDRLTIDWSIDPEARRVDLPPLTVQPVVENALKHGVSQRRASGRIRIAAVRVDGRIAVSVSDNGDGFPARIVERTGLGHVRARLAVLFGDRASLRIESTSAGSTVTIELPAEGEGEVGG